jgi:anionic cell wall polymer biosynthesis LytR-Cps2A-Psr (LCP) family protein
MKKHTLLYLVVFGITAFILIMYHFINTNYKSTHEDKKTDNLFNCQNIRELEKQAKQGKPSALSELVLLRNGARCKQKL